MEQQKEKPTCDYCGKQVYGREGKKYCNVDCKNNYNSKIRSELRARENRHFPRAFRQIKRNYRILLNYQVDKLEAREKVVYKEDLEKQGFNFIYCTTALLQDRKVVWYCFDHSWQEEGYTKIRIFCNR